MPTEQEVLDYLNENGLPKDYRDNLRDQFVDLQKKYKELEPKANLYEKSQRRPLIEEALKEHAQVDTSKLTKRDWKVIEDELSEGDLTPERVTSLASEWEFETAAPTQTPPQDQPPAAGVVNQATSQTGTADTDSAFYAELEAAAPGDETKAVLAKWGRLETQT